MTKIVVTDTALKAGEPWGHAPIRVELVDTNGDPVTPAYVTSTGVLVEPFTTVAGADGGCLYNVRIGDVDNLINGDQGSGTVRGLRATTATVLGNTATLDGLSNVNTAAIVDGIGDVDPTKDPDKADEILRQGVAVAWDEIKPPEPAEVKAP